MVHEFLEVDSLEVFSKVAEKSSLIIRIDPFLFAQFYSFMFFINLGGLDTSEVRRLFDMLKGKTVIVKKTVKAYSLAEFTEKATETAKTTRKHGLA